MTVEVTNSPARGSEEDLRGRALDLLRTETLASVVASDEPLRTVDVARGVADALGLTLGEEEMGGLATLVRMVLDSDPLFSQANRQWDLALRMGRAEGDRRKPVERAVEDFLDLLGRPSTPELIAELVAAVYGRTPDYYVKMIERLVETRPQFFRVAGSLLATTRWLLDLSSDDPEDVECDNFPDSRPLAAMREAAQTVDSADPVAYARDLIAAGGGPADNKAIQFLTWSRFPDSDPLRLYLSLATDPSYHLERGPSWVDDAGHQAVLEAVRALTREPQAAGDLLAAAAPAEEEEVGILAPTTVRVSDEDLEQVRDFMSREMRTYRVPDLLQQVLEAFPGSRTYVGAFESLTHRMREDDRFRWVGFDRFRLAGTLASEIETFPEGLVFDEREYLGEEGAEVDKPVDFREWKFNLDEQVQHYLVQDVGDDSTHEGASPTRLETSVPLHHYVTGTLYLRRSDRGFFPGDPDLLQVILVTDDGIRHEVWVNNRFGLVFGLKEWYDANLPWVGGRYAIERVANSDEYRLVYGGEVEPLMDIPVDRLQQLLALRTEAMTEGLPLATIVQRILKAYPEGIHFVTLFTQVNVVRRIRKVQLASSLSSQRYFTQTIQAPGIWHYDEKRAAKGKKKGGPKRPMREMYDEDEDEFEE